LFAQIKQIHNILNYLNDTKAQKDEVDIITRSVQKNQGFTTEIPSDSSSSNEDRLISFLKAKKWQEANEETAQILLKLAKKQKNESLNSDNIKLLSIEELETIDRMWSTYSDKRFSWSIQKQIWEELGGQPERFDNKCYDRWAIRVGWRIRDSWKSYSDLNTTDESPVGHFPAIPLKWSNWGAAWCGTETVLLFSQIPKTQFDPSQNVKRDINDFKNKLIELDDRIKKQFNGLNNLF
jgi:GUN4-like